MAASFTDSINKNKLNVISLTKDLEEFLGPKKPLISELTKSLKSLYDITKTSCHWKETSECLPELIVADFDDEQIWQQLELDNNQCVDSLLIDSSKLLANKTACSFKSLNHSHTSVDIRDTEERTLKKKSNVKSKGKQNISHEDIESEKSDSEADICSSDEEFERIKQNVEEGHNDDDKFFDFTGDSDEDLNFDFGPLGHKGDLDEELFNDDQNKNEKHQEKKRKKTVTFEDEKEDGDLLDKSSKSKTNKKKKSKGSIVDDKFFKLAELEQFLDQEDKREEKRLRREQKKDELEVDEDEENEDEDIDLFAEMSSEDEDFHYKDFFDPPEDEEHSVPSKPGKKHSTAISADDESKEKQEEDEMDLGDDDIDDEEEEENSFPKKELVARRDLFEQSDSEGEDVADILGGKRELKSSFEVRQQRLKKKMSALEEEMLAEKPWQMAGEVTGGKRPENSLLQENLQFEHTTRLPPEITEETTKSLEDLIKQRIKDKAWDDVERKVKPKEAPFEYKKCITLDQEKSKQSLSEIYEQEYLKQQRSEEVEKVDPDHEEIKKSLQSLFIKLDALSNFHYTPKQASAEIQVVTNQPSITMEEVAPVSVSDRQLLAPEEIKDKQKSELKGDTEKTKSDRLRRRKEKKKAQRMRHKEKEKRQKLVDKMNPGFGNKYSKEKAMQRLEKDSKESSKGVTVIKDTNGDKSGLTSSKVFFTQLQEQVVSNIAKKKEAKRKNKETPTLGGKALKL